MALPSGTVTFLFSDIEGSTQRWESHREAMQDAVRKHDTILRATIESESGHVFKTVGDAFYAVFATAAPAIAAAVAAQRALEHEDWSRVDGLRVRMAIHTGSADERQGDYFGSAVNRVARLLGIGHGGQILTSGVTADLVQGQMPPQATLRDLGSHRLKDLAFPEQVYQVLAPDLARDFSPLRSLAALPNNLPLQLTSFVGRDEEVAEIQELLARSRLVTLVGSGGVGKTRTSLQVAADRLDAHPDGVWLIELAPLTDPEMVAPTIAGTLGVSVAPTQRPIDAVLSELRERTALLVFDNCEHMVAQAAAVAEQILRHCPAVTILASSREGLGIAGESVYRMPSLRVPPAGETLTAAAAMQFGSVALFSERAAAVSKFALTDGNAGIVADVCRRLDGIALAIELAAPRLKVLSVDELDKRLNDRFRILTGGSRNALPRQQTLRALIDWSYDLLSEDEKTLFRRLGIFVGGFTLEAMSAVCADERIEDWEAVDLLQSLVEKSLVVAEIGDAEQRYRLLESTRQYALERLHRDGESEIFGRKHAVYFADLADRCDEDYLTLAFDGWLSTYAVELDNFRAALDWAMGNAGDIEIASALAGSLARLWRARGLAEEGLRACEAIGTVLGDRAEENIAAPVWLATASLTANLFYKTRRMDAAQRALRLYESLGNEPRIVDSLLQFGDVLRQLDRAEEALEPLERALQLSRRRGDRYRAAATLSRLSLAQFYLGHTEKARALTDEARTMSRALGRPDDLIVLTLNLAELEANNGNMARAIELAREALSQMSPTRHAESRSTLLANLAGYLVRVGEIEEAVATIREAIAVTKERQESALLTISFLHAAMIGVLRGRAADAARLQGYVAATFESLGSLMEPVEQQENVELTELLQAQLSDEEMAALNEEGRRLIQDHAISIALALLDPVAAASYG